jgi:hypothetical protein
MILNHIFDARSEFCCLGKRDICFAELGRLNATTRDMLGKEEREREVDISFPIGGHGAVFRCGFATVL